MWAKRYCRHSLARHAYPCCQVHERLGEGTDSCAEPFSSSKLLETFWRMLMTSPIQVRALLLVTCLSSSFLLLGTGCSAKPDSEKVTPAASQTAAAPAAVILVPGTTFSAEPNPVPASNPVTKLTWSAKVSEVEVRIGSPDGKLFARNAGQASAVTGNWVYNNMTFYLQDGTAKNPTDKDATLATLTVLVK